MRQGGSYIVDKQGKRKLVHRTQTHPEGNRARDASGAPLGALKGEPVPPPRPQKEGKCCL